MFNLIIMLHEKVSVGFQCFTLRMLTLFAGRVTWGESVCLGLPCPHHFDHITGQTVCFRKQMNTHTHRHTHTHFRHTEIACNFWSSNNSKFDDRNGMLLLEFTLDRKKILLLYSNLKQQISIHLRPGIEPYDIFKNTCVWASPEILIQDMHKIFKVPQVILYAIHLLLHCL